MVEGATRNTHTSQLKIKKRVLHTFSFAYFHDEIHFRPMAILQSIVWNSCSHGCPPATFST